MDPENLSFLLVFGAALLLLLYAATAESALNSLSRARYQQLVEQGQTEVQALATFLDQPSRYLMAMGFLRLISLVAAISAGTLYFVSLALPRLTVAIVAAALLLLVVLFREVLPRAIGTSQPEAVVLRLQVPLQITVFLLAPFAALLSRATSGLAQMLGHRGPLAEGPLLTPEELRVHVAASEEEGLIEEDEREMIDAVLDLEDTTVHEIMVPRMDIVALAASTPLAQVIDIIIAEGYSRLPVYEESIDNIIGVLYAKDLFPLVREGNLAGTARDLARPAYFVPETKRIDELLNELQTKKVHMAIVVDEYGGTAGLATIEDLLEEIVGEIQDEYDAEEAKIVEGQNGEAIFDATVSIDDVNDLMGLHLESEEVDTVGGLIYEKLKKVPQVGDQVTSDGAILTVVSTMGRRIKQVRITPIVRSAEQDQSVA